MACSWPTACSCTCAPVLDQRRQAVLLFLLPQALGKHGGGRDAEADLLRLAEEDPELLAAPAPPPGGRRAVRWRLTHPLHGWQLRLGSEIAW
jgi:hypothetical protein